MRDNWLSNRIFKSYDDLVDHCCYAWNKLVDQPLENHVHRIAPVGPRVLINETWYYGAALTVWQSTTLGFYLLGVRAVPASTQPSIAPDLAVSGKRQWISDPLWLLLALAFPSVLINVGHGQNGLLTA